MTPSATDLLRQIADGLHAFYRREKISGRSGIIDAKDIAAMIEIILKPHEGDAAAGTRLRAPSTEGDAQLNSGMASAHHSEARVWEPNDWTSAVLEIAGHIERGECSWHNAPDILRQAPTIIASVKNKVLKQLPDGMKHCTIQFKECERGHGWLTATNWVDHGCPTCAIAAAYQQALGEAKAAIAVERVIDSTQYGKAWNAACMTIEHTIGRLSEKGKP